MNNTENKNLMKSGKLYHLIFEILWN